jgi:hypothetical protein
MRDAAQPNRGKAVGQNASTGYQVALSCLLLGLHFQSSLTILAGKCPIRPAYPIRMIWLGLANLWMG